MLFPLFTSTKRRVYPWGTWTLVFANVAVFLLTKDDLTTAIQRWGFVPDQLTIAGCLFRDHWPTLVTYAFLHGNWFHVGSNMLFLCVFGSSVEQSVRGWRLWVAYLLGAAFAAIIHARFDPQTALPCVGASGAVSAMLGTYLTLEGWRGRVVSLGPLLLLTETPGWFFVGVWFALQLMGLSESQNWLRTDNNIAWYAHLGGFVAGIACGLVVRRWRRD